MKKILSIFFILITIGGTFHFSLATHYCGGKVADRAFGFGKAEASCGMENGKAPCEQETTFGKNCCHNHTLSFEGTDKYIFSSAVSVVPVFQICFFDAIANLLNYTPSFSSAKNAFSFHSPPANYLSALSFLQVFRI